MIKLDKARRTARSGPQSVGGEADEPPPGTPDPPSGLMVTEAVQRGSFTGTMWIVARDSRGATSWMEVPVSAFELDPACTGPPPLQGCSRLDFACL